MSSSFVCALRCWYAQIVLQVEYAHCEKVDGVSRYHGGISEHVVVTRQHEPSSLTSRSVCPGLQFCTDGQCEEYRRNMRLFCWENVVRNRTCRSAVFRTVQVCQYHRRSIWLCTILHSEFFFLAFYKSTKKNLHRVARYARWIQPVWMRSESGFVRVHMEMFFIVLGSDSGNIEDATLLRCGRCEEESFQRKHVLRP